MKKKAKKTRYSDKELALFDKLIDEKLKKASEQLEYYKTQLREMAESADSKVKGLDDGLVSVEAERLNNLAVRQEKLIIHLQNAKVRIKNKVYGICREFG